MDVLYKFGIKLVSSFIKISFLNWLRIRSIKEIKEKFCFMKMINRRSFNIIMKKILTINIAGFLWDTDKSVGLRDIYVDKR